MLTQLVAIPFGIVCVLVGLVLAPLPIPFGLPLILFGSFVIVGNSTWAAGRVRVMRERYHKFNVILRWLERRAPGPMARVLRRTRFGAGAVEG